MDCCQRLRVNLDTVLIARPIAAPVVSNSPTGSAKSLVSNECKVTAFGLAVQLKSTYILSVSLFTSLRVTAALPEQVML